MDSFDIQFINDSDQKAEICAEIIQTLPEWFGLPEANENYIKGMVNRDVFAACDNGHAIGLIALKYHFNKTAEIWWMGIKPEYHHKGIGKALFAAARQCATDRGCDKLIVQTLSPRSDDEYYARTRQFYETVGFQPLFEEKENDPVNPMMWMISSL